MPCRSYEAWWKVFLTRMWKCCCASECESSVFWSIAIPAPARLPCCPCHWLLTPALLLHNHHSTTQHTSTAPQNELVEENTMFYAAALKHPENIYSFLVQDNMLHYLWSCDTIFSLEKRVSCQLWIIHTLTMPLYLQSAQIWWIIWCYIIYYYLC